MRIPKLLPLSENMLAITYKLLHDGLFLLLASFIMMLIAEGAIPGIISQHISLTRIVVVIFLTIGAITWIGNKLQITYQKPVIKKNRLLPVLILLAFLLIGNSLLKFALWENMLITLMTLFLFYLFYKLIYSSE